MSDHQAELLLINNNNTRTKFALASRHGVIDHRAIPSREVTVESVCALLGDWEYEKVVLASVVPANVPALVEAQAGRPLVELSHRIELGIAIDFPDPSKIGADRLANAVAVAARRPDGPVIVVDFGTAVTFDIIDPDSMPCATTCTSAPPFSPRSRSPARLRPSANRPSTRCSRGPITVTAVSSSRSSPASTRKWAGPRKQLPPGDMRL
jgi:hypothetical protein